VAILVTRPAPDNAATAVALRARGFEPMLAPMLVFQPLPFRHDSGAKYRGVILTSTNAIRAIAAHPMLAQLQALPAFAVGATTAQAARDVGFGDVRAAEGDASSLRELIAASVPKTRSSTLLYPSATDVSRDLKSELGLRGIEVFSLPVYRMAALDEFPAASLDAFAHNAIQAVLHYSRRSALAFVSATRRAGLEISALALPQVCLSDQIAAALRDAGAGRVVVAKAPNEAELFDALEQVLRR
jgi:uroporphyrinogen-III synthase